MCDWEGRSVGGGEKGSSFQLPRPEPLTTFNPVQKADPSEVTRGALDWKKGEQSGKRHQK